MTPPKKPASTSKPAVEKATPEDPAGKDRFTITAPADLILSPVVEGDQHVRLIKGIAADVSEHQAVHSLARPDLQVTLPAGYAAALTAAARSGSDS